MGYRTLELHLSNVARPPGSDEAAQVLSAADAAVREGKSGLENLQRRQAGHGSVDASFVCMQACTYVDR